MKLGFTGTRDGTTIEQHQALSHWIRAATVPEFHHGCCIGCDSEAFDIVNTYAKDARVVAHMPTIRSLVCATAEDFSDETREPLPYLVRNRAIVDACDVLLACPKGPEEQRSGTWSTVRYARKQGKRVVVFWPDGEVTEEEGKAN